MLVTRGLAGAVKAVVGPKSESAIATAARAFFFAFAFDQVIIQTSFWKRIGKSFDKSIIGDKMEGDNKREKAKNSLWKDV